MKPLKGFLDVKEASALALMARSADGSKKLLSALSPEARKIGQSIIDYKKGNSKKALHPAAKAALDWVDNEKSMVKHQKELRRIRDDILSYIETKVYPLSLEDRSWVYDQIS